jgi:DMSO reductase family type II enzyme chaperone
MDQGCSTRPAGDDRDFVIALCRSLIYETLAIGFQPRRTEGAAALDGDRPARMVDAARLVDELRGSDLQAAALEVARRHAGTGVAGLQADYGRLFGHTTRSQVPAYETEYGDDVLLQRPHELSDIGGFLGAFGLRADPRSHERLDHVACELEFMAFLARKQAHAIEIGDAAMIEATRNAEALFLKDHLGRFIPSFAARVRREDEEGFHGALADLCRRLVLDDCRAHRIEPGTESLRLRIPLDDGAPVACGTPDCTPGAGCGPGADVP